MSSEEYRAEVVPRAGWEQWEALLDRCPQDNPFVRLDWLDPLARAVGARVEVSICYRGDQPVGGFAAFVRRGRLGLTARLPPTTPYNTVAILPRTGREPLRAERHDLGVLRALRRHARERYDYVRFVHHPALRDIRAFEWDGWRAAVFYTHWLSFHAGCDPMSAASPDLQRRAARAAQAGVRVEREEKAEPFYPLLVKTYERQRLPVEMGRDAYLQFTRHLSRRGMLEVWLARAASGEALAGQLVVRDERAAYLWMAAADPTQYDSGGNQLLMIENIRDLSSRVPMLDLCGAFSAAVAHYKAAAGGELTPYYTVWRASGRRARCATMAKELLIGLGWRRGGYW